MSSILFYSPFNQRSRDTESLMIAFHRQGHKVYSLSQREGNGIHPFLRQHGIETHSVIIRSNWRLWRHLKHLFHFIQFCHKHRINIVYSHLEPANFIASAGQYFIKGKVYICRHHSDQYMHTGADQALSYRLTYFLARKIIVVSEAAKSFMVKHEKINPGKIIMINLAYDFHLYPQPDPARFTQLQDSLQADFILVTVGQLTRLKNPFASIRVLHLLQHSGYSAKLLLVGKGELEDDLKQLVKELGLERKVVFTGYVNNVLDYISISAFMLHPSGSESSCVAVKEAGLVQVPVIVCSHVGDFDEYIRHGENGFKVNYDNFAEEAAAILDRYVDSVARRRMGKQLHDDVLERFSIDKVLHRYDQLNSGS